MTPSSATSAELSEQDALLVQRVLSGEDGCFDQLVHRYHKRLYHIAYGILGNQEDAEEVVQDAFVKAYRNLKTFRADSSFYTWIQRIVVNTARDKFQWLRRRGSQETYSISAVTDGDSVVNEEDFQIPSEAYSPDKLLLSQESMSQVDEAFRKLPDSMRETMVLRHIDSLPYDEISTILGCNVGTVKSRLARGREMLYKYLSEVL